MSTDYPKTAEELLALPEAGFGAEDRLINGQMRRVPVVPALKAFYVAEDMVLTAVDVDGSGWGLAQYVDGRYCRVYA